MRAPALVLVSLLLAAAPAAAQGGGHPLDVACGFPEAQAACAELAVLCAEDVVVLACAPSEWCEHEPTSALCSDEPVCDEVCRVLMCQDEPQATTCALVQAILQELVTLCERDPGHPACTDPCAIYAAPFRCRALGPEDCPAPAQAECRALFADLDEAMAQCDPVAMPYCEEPCRPHPILGDPCWPVCGILEPGALMKPTETIPECIP